VLDVTHTDSDADAACPLHAVIDTVNIGATPACDTENVLDTGGLPVVVVNVSAPERAAVPVFAAALTVTDLVPDTPETGLTVNHDTLDDTCHDAFDDKDTDVDDADADGPQLEAIRVSAGGSPAA